MARKSKAMDQGNNYNLDIKRGNDQTYLARKIMTDSPETFDRLKQGEYRSVRAAAMDCGIVKERKVKAIPVDTPDAAIRALLRVFTVTDLAQRTPLAGFTVRPLALPAARSAPRRPLSDLVKVRPLHPEQPAPTSSAGALRPAMAERTRGRQPHLPAGNGEGRHPRRPVNLRQGGTLHSLRP